MSIDELAAVDAAFRRHLLVKVLADTRNELAARRPGGAHFGARVVNLEARVRLLELQLHGTGE